MQYQHPILSLLIVFLLSNNVIGQSSTSDSIALQQLVLDFDESIQQKDSLRFLALFFQEEVPFTGIMSPDTEWSIKKDFSEFEGIAISNSRTFIREICMSEKEQQEHFYNVKISSDGIVGHVHFKYSFSSDTKTIQWGDEYWNVVKTGNTWLITDVIYSIRFPDIEAIPIHDFVPFKK